MTVVKIFQVPLISFQIFEQFPMKHQLILNDCCNNLISHLTKPKLTALFYRNGAIDVTS